MFLFFVLMLRKRVTLIVQTKKGIILARHAFNFRYALPGGGLKKMELPSNAARREIKEEFNLKVLKMKKLFELNRGIHRHFVFLVSVLDFEKMKTNWEIRKIAFYRRGDTSIGRNRICGSAREILNKAGFL